MFFLKQQQSLGKQPIAVENEGEALPQYAKFIENVRFVKNNVLFVTLNIPGSNNGFETFDLAAAQEFFERNPANLAWIDDSFRKAREENAKAVVLAFQANPHNVTRSWGGLPPASGYLDTVNAIERNASTFGKPVLIVQGDNHLFEVSAFRNAAGRSIPMCFACRCSARKMFTPCGLLLIPRASVYSALCRWWCRRTARSICSNRTRRLDRAPFLQHCGVRLSCTMRGAIGFHPLRRQQLT